MPLGSIAQDRRRFTREAYAPKARALAYAAELFEISLDSRGELGVRCDSGIEQSIVDGVDSPRDPDRITLVFLGAALLLQQAEQVLKAAGRAKRDSNDVPRQFLIHVDIHLKDA